MNSILLPFDCCSRRCSCRHTFYKPSISQQERGRTRANVDGKTKLSSTICVVWMHEPVLFCFSPPFWGWSALPPPCCVVSRKLCILLTRANGGDRGGGDHDLHHVARCGRRAFAHHPVCCLVMNFASGHPIGSGRPTGIWEGAEGVLSLCPVPLHTRSAGQGRLHPMGCSGPK